MNNILIVIVLQRGCLPKHWAASCIFSEPVCSRMWPHFVAQSCRHKTANCKRVATVSIDDLRGWLRNSLRVFTKLTHALTKTIRRSVAHALLFVLSPHLFWDVRKKWQFWTIAAANANLYGGFPLLVNSTRAESMFERHSSEHSNQAQPRLQEK